MIVAVGVDTVAIARIEQLRARGGERFLARVYTAAERDYCSGRAQPHESFAARFAAKEAVMKCLGTGWTRGTTFLDIEIVRDEAGATAVALRGAAAAHAARLGISHWHLSLTHDAGLATAFVVAERRAPA